jgi:hypothetical protein
VKLKGREVINLVLKINGTQIKQPKSFDIERFNITKSGRLASGDMSMDIIAKKWKLLFSYDVLEGEALDTILSFIDTNNPFFTVEWEDNNNTKTATMYVGAIKKKTFREGNRWYWKDVNFDFIER